MIVLALHIMLSYSDNIIDFISYRQYLEHSVVLNRVKVDFQNE